MGGRRWIAAVLTAVAAVLIVGGPAALAQSTTDDPAQLEAGQAVFAANCAGCHGSDGAGSQLGRSLIGIAQSEPDRLVHINSVTAGKGNMPAFGPRLDPDQIDAAVSYVRLTFVDESATVGVTAEPELAVTGAGSTTLLLATGLGLLLAGIGLRSLRPRRADGSG